MASYIWPSDFKFDMYFSQKQTGPILDVSSMNCVFRYNLLFFVSGGGKFNYQGTKRWLEDNLDHTGAVVFMHNL